MVKSNNSRPLRPRKKAEQLGLPELQILEIGMRLRFVIPFAEQLPVKNTAKQVEAQEVEAQVDKDNLAACTRQPVSSSEIAAALGHKKLSDNLRKALPRLKQAGLLESTIPDKPQSKLQKYRLTERGAGYLEKTDNKQGET
jgi:hypothetical protein